RTSPFHAAAEEFARREGVHLVQPAAQSLSDFVGASGKLAGKTIDFMFTSSNTSRSAGSAWVKAENSFFEHVAKYDVVVLQMRNLSKAQIADVMRWIGALSSEDQAKIKYLN
ncbi:hypothetical protein, partial [Paludibaculum fermentans]|uniref:hypothetical protein n=1 Tax=Paludibaculum fermentans TaxID=1473598 RepID=UPI003EC105CF